MVGAVVDGHVGGQLHEHLVEALALLLGLSAGGLLAGLAVTQGLFDPGAG